MSGSTALGPRSWRSRPPVRTWRRSLQTRVVVLTLLMSALVVLLLGVVLLRLVGHGLVTDKTRAAQSETASGLAYAQQQLTAADGGTSPDTLLRTVVLNLATRGSPAGIYDVAILPSAAGVRGYASRTDLTLEIPVRLRTSVRSGDEASTFTTVHRGGHGVRALVIGVPLTSASESYELYYVFPLTSEVHTIGLVRHAVEAAGAVLLVLLAAIAAIVTRQVVRPVRLAAGTAGRLAAGRLEERMAVRGEDDLARLAVAFNGMAQSLQTQIGQLEELSRVQQRFTADVSHELRTPLTTVRMAADVLHGSRAAFPPAAARSAELLSAQLDRFEALLGDLLEISRYDALVAVLEPEPVDLTRLVRDAVAEARPHAERVGCLLDLTRVPSVPVPTEADPRRVLRLLRNLLENAIEHSEGRPVQVALAASGDAVGVRVRDHGVGLRPGEAELVFNRFWRADPARARSTGGTGLGLSIALEDARLHGGWLQAWGRPGQGASFRMVLPRRSGETLRVAPLSLVPEPASPVVDRPGRTPARDPAPAARPPRSPAPPAASRPGPLATARPHRPAVSDPDTVLAPAGASDVRRGPAPEGTA